MSDLTVFEKRKLEQLLGMSSGYVLDFSNRSFADFILDSTSKDIYAPDYAYDSGSKANRLRAFWRTEPNLVVGKLMSDMLDYAEDTGRDAAACRSIINRLLQGTAPVQSALIPGDGSRSSEAHRRSEALAQIREEFLRLAIDPDRRKAGLALEGLMNRLFELSGLQPRQPFRLEGEQIDGSFELEGQFYLVEIKWENHALPEADLLIFRGKIEEKSTFTRGVFIALKRNVASA